MEDIKKRLADSQKKMEQVKAKLTDAAETAQVAGMLAKDKLDEKIAEVKGNMAAGEEAARMAAERGKSKLSSTVLKARMSVDAAKDAITEKKEAHDQKSQEKRILELLDYADDCEELAAQLTAEADLALLEAAAETIDYYATYGE